MSFWTSLSFFGLIHPCGDEFENLPTQDKQLIHLRILQPLYWCWQKVTYLIIQQV